MNIFSTYRTWLLASVLVTTLNAQQSPFTGTPISIPGIIEAEDFDNGGEGVAFHDIDELNSGGEYRDTAVDIEISSENGSPNVGWINADEWLEYTVNVQTTGLYNLAVRVASESAGGTFHIEFDGVNVTGPQDFAATGGWQTYTTLNIPDILLSSGAQVMLFYMETAGFNVNYTNITLQEAVSVPQVIITSPADDSLLYLDQLITITADATDSTGIISNVEFYANDILIGQDNSTPYMITWQPEIADKYDLVAIAENQSGVRASSEKVDVTVNLPVYENELFLSHQRGFYEAPFSLTIDADSASSSVIYTIDGSNPETSATAQTAAVPAVILIDPGITNGRGLTPGVVIRAYGADNGQRKTDIETHSYMFINAVIGQSYPGAPWPQIGEMNGQSFRYNMDQNVVSEYSNQMEASLLDIPSISLVLENDALFSPESGIYVNALQHGKEWEKPVSAELINPDGSDGFQINCGVRIRGGYSRHDGYPKHAFRLFFRREYGEPSLGYPLFENEGVDEFEKIDLRASQNYSWANGYYNNTMVREVFSRDIQGAMHQPYTRSRIYHLYVNGLYFGLFQTQERAEANFAESYLGGNDNEYDVIKVNIDDYQWEIEATDGNLEGWQEVWSRTQAGFSSNDAYFALQGKNADGTANPLLRNLVDIDNLIDYLLIIFYTGNFDAPVSKFLGESSPNNFYAIYNRTRNEGFKFFAHDAEHSLFNYPNPPGIGIEEDRVNLDITVNNFEKFHPYWLHKRLAENPEYRIRFADRTYKHFYNQGVFTEENMQAIVARRVNELQMAIIAESARWGDTERDKARWLNEIAEITDAYIPTRTPYLFDQLITADLFPQIEPPLFRKNGVEISSTQITEPAVFMLEMINQNSAGIIEYTIDGSDPRLTGGAVSALANHISGNGTIEISSSLTVKARIRNGNTWSALHELNISLAQDLADLIISEIHYHPLDNGTIGGREYEFIELKNEGNQNLNLSLLSFVKAITYAFPSGAVLGPGGYLVLASNAVRFTERYGFNPFDEFSGQLDNNGEKIVLVDSNMDTLIQIRYYDNAPWPVLPDSLGHSLEWSNSTGNHDTNDPLNWKASQNVHGNPQFYDNPLAIDFTADFPSQFKLMQNYPNPFNPQTTISYQLPVNGKVLLTVYDVAGREVINLVNRNQNAGSYSVTFNAAGLASGLYFYKLRFAGLTELKKMIYLK